MVQTRPGGHVQPRKLEGALHQQHPRQRIPHCLTPHATNTDHTLIRLNNDKYDNNNNLGGTFRSITMVISMVRNVADDYCAAPLLPCRCCDAYCASRRFKDQNLQQWRSTKARSKLSACWLPCETLPGHGAQTQTCRKLPADGAVLAGRHLVEHVGE